VSKVIAAGRKTCNGREKLEGLPGRAGMAGVGRAYRLTLLDARMGEGRVQ